MTLNEVKKILADNGIEYFVKREDKNLVSIRLWVENNDTVKTR